MSELLIVQKEPPVCTITFNRPEKRNSLNPEMLYELVDTLRGLEREESIRAVVIRGAGRGAFSSGFDIGRIGQRESYVNEKYKSPVQYAGDVIEEYPYPVIAMIYGYCVGGGLELAVACDLRIAADTAKLGITPAKLGIVYLPTPLRRFLDVIGAAYTKELFFTGRLIDAHRAKEMGLVNQVVPEEELERYTYELAREIGENAPLSLKGIKLAITKLTGFERLSPEDAAYLEELRQRAMESEDLKEGRRAFQERRKPVFKGR